jgi:sortase A
MFPKGIIYERGKSPKRGEFNLHPTFFQKITYTALRGVGAGLIGAMVIGLIFTYGPIFKEEVGYLLFGPKKEAVSSFSKLLSATSAKKVQEEARSYGVGAYFSVVIPKIGAESDIIANVDAGNSKEYQKALEEGVAHARGTFFPGQGKTIFLFAHSTDSPLNIARYNAVFYLLRKLEKGDRIIVFFADKKYVYEVSGKITTTSGDTSWLAGSSEERLILQTCDPPGTTFRRLLVIAEPVP